MELGLPGIDDTRGWLVALVVGWGVAVAGVGLQRAVTGSALATVGEPVGGLLLFGGGLCGVAAVVVLAWQLA